MSNPIRLYIVPSVGLKFDCIYENQPFRNYRPLGQDPMRYEIPSSYLEAFSDILKPSALQEGKTLHGWMSPISNVTFPAEIMKFVGIQERAKYYAYMHPPEGLSDLIDWTKVNLEEDHYLSEDLTEDNMWAMPFCAVLGAYVYFDDNSLLQVNALSLLETRYKLDMAGPFPVSDEARADLRELNRVHPLTIDIFHENFFVALGVTVPGEMFRSKYILQENHKGMHGAFVFYRDNGTALVYEVDSTGYIDPTGNISSIHDAFEAITTISKTAGSDFVFRKNYFFPEVGSDIQLKKRIQRAVMDGPEQNRLTRSLKDDFAQTLIHKACWANCSKEVIEKLIEKCDNSQAMMRHSDDIGWLPLHYACRHCQDDFELIETLVKAYPQAVTKQDIFNRCPLHIAIDSCASVEVINLLLTKDTEQKTIYLATKNLERNAFHIACNRGVSKEVFEIILEADKIGDILTKKTRLGCTPLQLAIERRLSHEIIEMLIHSNERVVTPQDEMAKNTIYTRFNGMVPLAHACWNKSSYKTISVLLDHDFENSTIDETVKLAEAHEKSKVALQPLDGMVPLHLALRHSDEQVVGLLLQKEDSKKRSNRYSKTVFRRDSKMRLPLHIACRRSAHPSIVEQLLTVDIRNETTRAIDVDGCTPLHLACDREDANGDIVKLLLDAEKEYLRIVKLDSGRLLHQSISSDARLNFVADSFLPLNKTCAHHIDKSNKSPLFHAVKSEAEDSVVTQLLKPENFYLNGFNSLVDELALILQNTKSDEMQAYVIDELARRCYFCVMILDIYFHAVALVAFIFCSERLINATVNYTEITIIWSCIGIAFVRECVRFTSQRMGYLLDFWSWCEVSSLVLLAFANLHFTRNIGEADPEIDKRLLTACGAMLVINLVFFLRTTFLPFARFVGGLILIVYTLVPFFIVTFLMLLAFAYGFFMSGTREETCDTLNNCYFSVMQAFFAGADETKDYLDVLYGGIIIVVLLNVVIAIVEQAWSKAKEETMRLFWTYRLEFLAENRVFVDINFTNGIEDYIDSIEDVQIADLTPWTKGVFALVDERDKYENPKDYFPEDIAGKIRKVHSLNASFYWVRTEYIANKKRLGRDASQAEKTANKARMYRANFSVVTMFAVQCLIYGFLFILGIFTCGWFWPRSLRRKILSVGL